MNCVRSILPLIFLLLSGAFAAADVTGAGSTFVYPLVAKWADKYKQETGISVNYQSIGSGGGIKQIQSKTVDFGATDMPMKTEDLKKDGLVQFPLISGAVVPIVNVKGVNPGELKLTGALLADIFMGNVKRWNDPAIASINSKLKLPDQAITVVRRADGSGTTFLFSNYLSKVSPTWKEKIGEGSALQWPVGVGGKGNEGMASYVKQIDGAIGYVEYAYALQNKMSYTQLQNQAGVFVTPTNKAFSAAAAATNWTKEKDFYVIMTNAAGKESWPLAGVTFVLMQKSLTNLEQARHVLKFLSWAFKKGDGMAEELHYVALPDSLTKQIETHWKAEFRQPDGKPMAIDWL